MPGMLVLLRHGQTTRNVVEEDPKCRCRLIYADDEARRKVGVKGDRLLPLSEKGEEQARQAGRELRRKFGIFDIVFHSGFLRAERTAQLALSAYSERERRKTEIMVNSDLRERNPGYCYNMTEAEVNRHFPWFLDYWQSTDPFIRVPLGGESTQQMCDGRLRRFLECWKNPLFNGKKILAVSHYSAIVGLRYLLENWSYNEVNKFFRNNAGPKNCESVLYRRGDF